MKEYIIKVFDRYYLHDTGGDSIIETYSPLVATTFSSNETAIEWVKEYTDWLEFSEVVERTQELIDEFNEWSELMVRREVKKMDRSGTFDYDETKHTTHDVLEFQTKTKFNNRVPYESYKTWPDLSEVFKHIQSARVGDDGIMLEIKVSTESTYETFESEILYFLDYADINGITACVFDHYLCEHGNTVNLEFGKDTSDATISGSERFSGSLEECFEYLRKHRHYP